MNGFRAVVLAGILAVVALPSTAAATTMWTFHDTTLTGQLWDKDTETFSPITATVTGFVEVNTGVNGLFNWDVDVDSNWAPLDHRYKKGDAGNAATFPGIGLDPKYFALTFWSANIYLSVELEENLIETTGFKEIDLSWISGFNAIGDGTYSCHGPCASLPAQLNFPSSRARLVANSELAPIATPEPASLFLLGSGVIAVGAKRYRRRRASSLPSADKS